MRKDIESPDQTRDLIVDAFCKIAREEFDRYPTVVAVIKKAGFNRATFYRHFDDVFAVQEYMEDVIIGEIKDRIQSSLDTRFSGDGLVEAFVMLDVEYHGYLSVLFSPLYQAHFTSKLKHTLAPVFARMTGCDLSHPRVAAIIDMFFSAIMSNVARYVMGDNGLHHEDIVLLNKSLLTQWLVPQLQLYKGKR